jgi:chemotaxis protein methyltransferase CheR
MNVEPRIDDAAMAYFRRRFPRLLGIDVAAYKEAHVRRRLGALLLATGAADLPALADRLDGDAPAIDRFRNAFTVHVTECRRDPDAFAALESACVPALSRLARPVAVWSAACSRGAEPLSLALMLRQAGVPIGRAVASDVCAETVAHARRGGPFGARDVRNLTAAELVAHFSLGPDGYWASDCLRSAFEYRVHDLLAGPYDGPFDLIACRNVLLYMVDLARERVLARLADALAPGGLLFVGGTEMIDRPERLGLTCRLPCVYRKRAG